MRIIKHTETPNGAPVQFHKLRRAEIDFADGTIAATVHSWVNEQVYASGANPTWAWTVVLPLSLAQTIDQLEAAVIAAPNSPFAGGSVGPDLVTDLDTAKARRWAQLRAERNSRELGTFHWSGLEFDADADAQRRLSAAGRRAAAALESDAPSWVSVLDWTLADNTTVMLTAQNVLEVWAALDEHVARVHATARTLREQIEAAQTIEAVEAVTWPT